MSPKGFLFATYSQSSSNGREDRNARVHATCYTFNLVCEMRVRAVALISEAVKTPRSRLGSIKPSHQVSDFVSAANFSSTICNAGETK